MAQHSITVQNGAVESAEMPHKVTTSWVITIRPSGTEDVRVSVAQASQCSDQRALCDSDGIMIYNYPQVVISGPPTISQQVTPENEAATGQPTISGTPVVGNALTADTSAVSDGNGMTGASFSYQWVRDGSTISGATGSTYAVVENDQGHSLKAQVSFTDDDGFDETVTSSAVSVPAPIVTSAPPPAPTDLSVTLNTDGSLTLNWTAPSDDSVTGYQILRRRPQMDEGTLLVYVNDTGNTSTTYTDTATSDDTPVRVSRQSAELGRCRSQVELCPNRQVAFQEPHLFLEFGVASESGRRNTGKRRHYPAWVTPPLVVCPEPCKELHSKVATDVVMYSTSKCGIGSSTSTARTIGTNIAKVQAAFPEDVFYTLSCVTAGNLSVRQ